MRAIGARLLVVAALLTAAPGNALAQAIGREVLTRSDLAEIGVHRIDDLLAWAARGRASVEGFVWDASLDGAPSLPWGGGAAGDWLFVVDGQPIDLSAFGALYPELLPAGIQQIDSVTIVRGPTAAGGAVLAGGAIIVHSGPGADGAAAGVWARYGSETGDAGPYAYTPYATPNVDRTGPDYSGWLGYERGGLTLLADARYLRTNVGDPRLWERWGSEYSAFGHAGGARFRLGAEVAGGRHDVFFGLHEQVGQVYAPAADDHRRTFAGRTRIGVSGAFRLPLRATLRYQGLWSDERNGLPYLVVDTAAAWRTRSSAEVEVPVGEWLAAAGGGVHRIEPRPVGSLPDLPDTTAYHLFGGVTREPAGRRGTSFALRGGAVREGGRWHGFVTATAERGIARATDAGVTVELVRRPLPLGSVRELAPIDNPESARLIAGFETRRARSRLHIAAHAGLTEALHQGGGPPRSPWESRYSALQATLTVEPSMRLRGEVHHQLTWSSDPSLLPAHLTRARIAFAAAKSFHLSGALFARSAVGWPAPATGLPDDTLPAMIRIDLLAKKTIWDDRVGVELTVRNALNTPERYHPDGAELGVRVFASASVRL